MRSWSPGAIPIPLSSIQMRTIDCGVRRRSVQTLILGAVPGAMNLTAFVSRLMTTCASKVEWPRTVAGARMENYLDWMKSCYYVTITSHPAISVPAGFTSDDPPLPVGLQIVGRYRDDMGVLRLAHAFEECTQFWKQRPAVAN